MITQLFLSIARDKKKRSNWTRWCAIRSQENWHYSTESDLIVAQKKIRQSCWFFPYAREFLCFIATRSNRLLVNRNEILCKFAVAVCEVGVFARVRRAWKILYIYVRRFFFFLRDCTFNITNDGSVIKKDPSSYVFVWEKIPQKIYSTLLTARTTVGLVVNYAVSIGSVSIANNCRNNFTGPACTCRVCPHVLVYQNCLRLCNFLRRNAAWENTKVNFKFIDIAFRTDRNSEIVQ